MNICVFCLDFHWNLFLRVQLKWANIGSDNRTGNKSLSESMAPWFTDAYMLHPALIVDIASYHDDVIKWKHFPRYWPFVRGIHRSPVNSPHKGQWRGALMFSLICVWINGWVNNREAGDLRCYRAHYDVTVMQTKGHYLAWNIFDCILWRDYLYFDQISLKLIKESIENKPSFVQDNKISIPPYPIPGGISMYLFLHAHTLCLSMHIFIYDSGHYYGIALADKPFIINSHLKLLILFSFLADDKCFGILQ